MILHLQARSSAFGFFKVVPSVHEFNVFFTHFHIPGFRGSASTKGSRDPIFFMNLNIRAHNIGLLLLYQGYPCHLYTFDAADELTRGRLMSVPSS